MSDTQARMEAHLARSARQRRATILAIAVAAGGIAFIYARGGDGDDHSGSGGLGSSTTSGAQVLGVVVTQDPIAAPASPATFGDLAEPGDASTTTPSRHGTSSTTRPPATIIPPTVIANTTSTTARTTPSTIDLSTTSTAAPTTTEPPPG